MPIRCIDFECQEFLTWLKEKKMPGFMEYVTDNYFDDNYRTYAEELEYLGGEIKRSVVRYKPSDFDLYKAEYEKLYARINVSLAKTFYHDVLDMYLERDFSNEEAKRAALETCWDNEAVRYWLPISALLKDAKGQEVYLVSRKEHSPKGKNFVTHSELQYLTSSGRDPWAYVQQRGVA